LLDKLRASVDFQLMRRPWFEGRRFYLSTVDCRTAGFGRKSPFVVSVSTEGPGTITVNADIVVENRSLLTTGFEEGSGGNVVVNGGIAMILQSSANMDGTNVSHGISMSQDSHTLFGIGVTVSGSITCDRRSRVWADVSGTSSVSADVDIAYHAGAMPHEAPASSTPAWLRWLHVKQVEC
jgi:hypothetical protein